MKKTWAFVNAKIRLYWPLIKSLQTGLLLSTGLAGYLSARAPARITDLAGLAASLFLAISGSTILNMWYDRDIDARMKRTHRRPAASGELGEAEVLRLGLVISILGVGGAVAIAPLYGLVVFAGLFFDVAVYTLWLKRRTCWSIVWGGVSGGMPILAGRVLATGRIDLVGALLTLAILFWIPTHTLTFSIKFDGDYRAAGIPTFPSTYGLGVTRALIAGSTVLAALSIGWSGFLIGVQAGMLRLIAVLASGLLLICFASVTRPSERANFALFRYASFYMLATMILLAMGRMI
ncbi:MAG TPA: UbiA family prenyltransferase [Anaerolineales bacterium]|nr:UbiA family prenyltransferase [Anaerolineales bacterium]